MTKFYFMLEYTITNSLIITKLSTPTRKKIQNENFYLIVPRCVN